MPGKSDLRKEMKIREGEFLLDGKALALETARIVSLIEASKEFGSSSCVLAYMALDGEVSLDALFRSYEGSVRFVIPKVTGPEEMEFREYDRELLSVGYKGILEPSDGAPVVKAEEVDFALIPGVAFSPLPDSSGFSRLGRGKGYYDRFLPNLRRDCLVAGVCFPFRVVGSVPTDAHDRAVDMLFF